MVKASIKKRIIALGSLLMAALLSAFAPSAAFASEGLTGDPIVVSSGVVWDPLNRDYLYVITEGASQVQVHCTALDGMVLSSPVTVTGGGVFLYKNGGEYTESLMQPISSPGEYVVMVNTGARSVRVLAFTIVGSTTGSVSSYTVPEGMLIVSAELDGEEIDHDYRSVNMSREGSYTVVSECVASNIKYTLETTVDRTPPELEFSGRQDRHGNYNSAVRITGIEREYAINASKDGEAFKLTAEGDGSAELTQSGLYVIDVFDAAGNSAEYTVFITAYLNASGYIFIALAAAAAAAVFIYVRRKKRRLRIG